MSKTIRGGMGLGDALYVQSVARHLLLKGESLRICSAWPDVFMPIIKMHGDRAKVVPFTRQGVDILAHYSKRKASISTTQFEDCCLEAGIKEPVELRLDWRFDCVDHDVSSLCNLLKQVRESRLPLVLVQLPRAPMGRTDGFGRELLPDCRAIQTAIDALRGRAVIVQVGSGKPLFNFTGIDFDLAGKTTIPELFDIARIADACLGYVSFLVPLAESLDKPSLFVWSRRGLTASHAYVRQITPAKILHKPSSHFVFDNAAPEEIAEAAHALIR